MILHEQEELTKLRYDRDLMLSFADLPMDNFWWATSKEFRTLAKKSYFDIPPIFHNISIWGKLLPDFYKK